MASRVSPNANHTPRNPILSPASTALPQLANTSTKVPKNSAVYLFMILLLFAPRSFDFSQRLIQLQHGTRSIRLPLASLAAGPIEIGIADAKPDLDTSGNTLSVSQRS